MNDVETREVEAQDLEPGDLLYLDETTIMLVMERPEPVQDPDCVQCDDDDCEEGEELDHVAVLMVFYRPRKDSGAVGIVRTGTAFNVVAHPELLPEALLMQDKLND